MVGSGRCGENFGKCWAIIPHRPDQIADVLAKWVGLAGEMMLEIIKGIVSQSNPYS